MPVRKLPPVPRLAGREPKDTSLEVQQFLQAVWDALANLDDVFTAASTTAAAAATVSLTIKQAAITLTASGDTTVIAAVTSKVLTIRSITFTTNTACTIIFKSGSTTKVPAMSFAANGGLTENYTPDGWFLKTTAGEAFVMTASTAATISGTVNYTED